MASARKMPIDPSGIPLFNPAVSKNYLLKCNDIRVADIWPFLSYTIRVARTGSRQLHKEEREFLLDLLEQAEYFFNTAATAPIKSQPLLYYYSFMNLAKVAINLNSYVGNGQKYNHGISDSITLATKLSNAQLTLWKSSPGNYSLSEHLLKMLEDKPLSYTGRGGNTINVAVKDLLRDCVGISKTYCEIYNYPQVFFKLKDVNLYSQSRKLHFEAEVCDCTDVVKTQFDAKGYTINKDADGKFILSADCSVKTTANPTISEKHTLSNKLRDKGIWSYTDGDAYKLYISPTADNMSSASVIYHIMFFFGSITRYHPDLFDEIISAKEYWLVSEFLKTQPLQFLYYIVSKINGSEILMSRQI